MPPGSSPGRAMASPIGEVGRGGRRAGRPGGGGDGGLAGHRGGGEGWCSGDGTRDDLPLYRATRSRSVARRPGCHRWNSMLGIPGEPIGKTLVNTGSISFPGRATAWSTRRHDRRPADRPAVDPEHRGCRMAGDGTVGEPPRASRRGPR